MSHGRDISAKPYAVVGSFKSGEDLVEAAKRTVEAGYKSLEAYSPIPVHGLLEAMDARNADKQFAMKDKMFGWIMFGGGLSGAIGGLALEAWVSAVAYPHNVGGKPLVSLPMFFPVLYECTILLTAFATVGGLFALCGLPKPHHPVFNAESFARASQDRFILAVDSTDPRYDEPKLRNLFHELNAESVESVMTSEGY